jgi:hypothetical protein
MSSKVTEKIMINFEVDRGLLEGKTKEEIMGFCEETLNPQFVALFEQARLLAESAPRNMSVSGSCTTTSGGGTSCTGTVTYTFSDIRLKEGIVFKHVSSMGLNVYEFSYRGSQARWQGAIAQEVQTIIPDAVMTHPSGFLMVDYNRIDVTFKAVARP